jgi:NADH-quinone oxidoreductase subunit B
VSDNPISSRTDGNIGLSPAVTDRGFIVTSVDAVAQRARAGSLMWNLFGLACCAIEMMQAAMPRYDMERWDHF